MMMKTPKPLTILVVSVDGVGHVNACIGTGRALIARGHRVIFLADEAFRGKLAVHGFEEHIVPLSVTTQNNAGEAWARLLFCNGILEPGVSQMDKYCRTMQTFMFNDTALESIRSLDQHTKEAIDLYKPDLFLIDCFLPPCVYFSSDLHNDGLGIPWVNNLSVTLLTFGFDESDSFPPAASGLA